jgi:hypothetical protein
MNVTVEHFKKECLQRLTAIETHLKDLTGNGQPGKIVKLEDRVSLLEAIQNQHVGVRYAITVAVSALSGFVGGFFARK